MGVKGLWRLLLPIGRRISLESLEGKILAIDASIWLTQFIKAMRDKETGKALPYAHLQGFLKRLCRLRYHGIKPVLVFDGVTPEIKKRETAQRRRRREQFASALHNDASVQRLAKRILAQNLKKEKKLKKTLLKAPPPAAAAAAAGGGGAPQAASTAEAEAAGDASGAAAFAEGFHPGDQERAGAADSAGAARPSKSDAKDPPSSSTSNNNAVSKEDEAAIMAAIQDMVNEEEEDKAAKKHNKANDEEQQQSNDWDDCAALEVDHQEKDDEDEEPANTLYDDCNGDGDDSMNISYIASLPPDKRKDAIEKAKRQQRLKSRQEFMPAAGNMDQFSAVQLTNFLKSSRLNKDIVTMAQQAVQHDQEQNSNTSNGGGGVMASDHTTRISLVRESEENHPNDNKDDRKMPARARGGNGGRGGRGRLHRIGQPHHKKGPKLSFASSNKRCYTHNDSSSSDDDDEWQNAALEDTQQSRKRSAAAAALDTSFHHAESSPNNNNKRTKRRIRIDEEEDDDDDDDQNNHNSNDNDGLPTEEELAGGFLVPDSIDNNNNNNNASVNVGGHLFHLGQHQHDEEGSGGGGFLKSSASSGAAHHQSTPSSPATTTTTTTTVARDATVRLAKDDDDDDDDTDDSDSEEDGGFMKVLLASEKNRKRSALTAAAADKPSILATSVATTRDDIHLEDDGDNGDDSGDEGGGFLKVSATSTSSGNESRSAATADASRQGVSQPVIRLDNDDTDSGSDSCSEDKESGSGRAGGCFLKSLSETVPARNGTKLTVQDDGSDSDSNDEQGSVKYSGFIGVKKGPSEVINLVDDDSTKDDESKPEATAPSPGRTQESAHAVNKNNSSICSGPQTTTNRSKSDAALAQEMEDRLLAQAIQDSEEGGEAAATVGIGKDPMDLWEESTVATSNLTRVGAAALSAASTSASTHAAAPLSLKQSNVSMASKGSDDDDDDDEDIDWEDGEDDDGMNSEEKTAALLSNVNDPKIPAVDTTNRPESDMDVIDGEEAESRLLADLDAGDRKRHATSPTPGMEADEFSTSSDKPGGTTDGRSMMDAEAYSAETAAALERAQATASNLANWAGAVFRRVVKEVGQDQGSPAKALPLPDPSEKKDGDDTTRLRSVEGVGDSDVHAQLKPPASRTDPSEQHRFAGEPETRNDSNRNPTCADSQSVHERQPLSGQGMEVEIMDHPRGNVSEEVKEATAAMLQEYDDQWTAERNQRERDSDTVTDEMKEDAVQLLRLFGVPYVEAPTEAEAQCAALEQLGLVDGIVTEDSDVFVFGGKRVYKNIFEERLYAEAYMADDAEREMAIGRNSMVALAMLLGSDYTEGVKGVGIVNSMEVLQAFDVSHDLKEGLSRFRAWLDGFDPSDSTVSNKHADKAEQTKEQIFHANHKTARTRWEAPSNFPSDEVMQAFLNPVVDKSTEPFSWGLPDVENLVLFCSRHMGWPAEDTRKLLEPVARNASGFRQTRIDSFMKYEDSIKFGDVKSQRLRDVLGLKAPEDNAGRDTQR